MNIIFFVMILVAFLAAAWQQLWWIEPTPEEIEQLRIAAEAAGQAPPEILSPMQLLTAGALDSAASSVTLAISLIGGMALFLGVMKVAEEGGMLTIIAKLIRPLMVRLFPDVPPDHPAMGAMILNLSANALGLGNAATPFGVRAMQELDTLNPEKGTATNAMALFLAINTSAVTLLPTGVIVIRDRMGSEDPSGIFATTLIATLCSTTAAVIAAKLYQRLASPCPVAVAKAAGIPVGAAAAIPSEGTVSGETAASDESAVPAPLQEAASEAYPAWVSALAFLGLAGLVACTLVWGKAISPWVIPVLIVGMLTFGWARGVMVYETLVQGAKDGFNIAVMIIPYLVAILVAVGMLKASGALDFVMAVLGPITSLVGLPAEALPMALMRPLSGSGASGVMIATMEQHGTDTYVGYLVSTLQGSTETTFYVLAVYFGAVGIRRTRHAMATALTADFVGIVAAVAACWMLLR